ncbi:MAG: trypsin-like serine protease [Chloroflexi bacterium]|nr:trypsin-like serine protease [Chloroflexota bacterium]
MAFRFRRRTALTVALTTSLLLAFVVVSPAAAIRYGDNDGNAHPWVGLMVAQNAAGNPLWRCSGTLLSPTVFLTAGHCVEPSGDVTQNPTHVEVWFGSHIVTDTSYPAVGANHCAGIAGYPCQGDAGGVPVENPNWDASHFWLHDDGLVIFDDPYWGTTTYGQLPSANQLDSLRVGHGTWFTAVGYGLQAAFPDAAGWKDQALKDRKIGHPWLYQINSNLASGGTDLILSDNASSGGTCFGDSGGPNFLGNSLVIAGVNSFVYNSQCAGFSGAYRLDHQADLDWINGYLE